jgi:hypothetical protein
VQISQAFKPDHDDVEYNQGKFMLRSLGLQVSSYGGRALQHHTCTYCAVGPGFNCSKTVPLQGLGWSAGGMRNRHVLIHIVSNVTSNSGKEALSNGAKHWRLAWLTHGNCSTSTALLMSWEQYPAVAASVA